MRDADAMLGPPFAGITRVMFMRSAAVAAFSARFPELPRLTNKAKGYPGGGARSRRAPRRAIIAAPRRLHESLFFHLMPYRFLLDDFERKYREPEFLA